MFTTVRGNELDLCLWELNLHTLCNKRHWSVVPGSRNSWYGLSDLKKKKDCLIWISHVVSCHIVKKLRWKIIL